jgi:hypothetical protein
VLADAVEASVEDGVLQILVPKAEEAKPKSIRVRSGGRAAIAAIAGTKATKATKASKPTS